MNVECCKLMTHCEKNQKKNSPYKKYLFSGQQIISETLIMFLVLIDRSTKNFFFVTNTSVTNP